VDLRDAYTGGHSRRVTAYSAIVLRALDLPADSPEVTLILAAARVHDIGKIGVPDAALNRVCFIRVGARSSPPDPLSRARKGGR